MDAARAVNTFRASLAPRTAVRKSGSRTVSTRGAFLRVCCGTSLSMVWLAHCTRSSALTAMTASCMLLSRVSSWRWLVCNAAKLSSRWRAVLSSEAATCPISSPEVPRCAQPGLRPRLGRQTARCGAAAGVTSGDAGMTAPPQTPAANPTASGGGPGSAASTSERG